MDPEKQALTPTAPSFPPATDPDTFYPPMENPPPYAPPYPDPSKYQHQQQHMPHQHQPQPAYSSVHAVPLHPQQQTIIQIVNPPLPEFGPRTASINCPYCNAGIQTRVTKRYTGATHFMAAILCFICCCCFAWAPYVCDCFNNSEHSCPNCKKYLGIYTHERYRRRY